MRRESRALLQLSLVPTLSDWIEGEMSEKDEMSSVSIGYLEVKRLVRLLVPVWQFECDVEQRRTQNQQIVAQ